MNKLELTQKICKVLSIITRIVMFASFIIAGLLLLYLLISLVVNTAFIYELIEVENINDIFDMQAYVIFSMVNIIASGVFAMLISRYLKKEIQDGTPFVKERVLELRKLGLKGIIISIITAVVSSILIAIFALITKHQHFENLTELEGSNFIGISLVFIVLSIILEAGCEEIEKPRQ